MLERFTVNGNAWLLRGDGVDAYATTMKSNFMDGRYDTGLRYKYPSITKVVINVPATIVFWSDGTKTAVKCAKNERFDAEKGVAMAIAKKFIPEQYGRKLKTMTDKAVSKYEDVVRKSIDRLSRKRIRKEETEEKHCCWNCKFKSLSFWDIPCRNCRSERDKSEWVPEEKKGR